MTNGERDIRGQAAWRVPLWTLITGLLLLPAVAMRFTREVNWTTTDFIFAGVLLIGAGALFEVIAWRVRRPFGRLLAGAAILGLVLVVWVEAAVGIFH